MASLEWKRDVNLEAALPASDQHGKTSVLNTSTSQTHSPTSPQSRQRTMPSACRSLVITMSICLVLGLGLTQVLCVGRTPCSEDPSEVLLPQIKPAPPAEPDSSFAALLRSASPEVIHRLLHEYLPEKYQHGIFESDRQAIEAATASDFGADSPLARIAKRQDTSNTTVTVAPPDITTSAELVSSTIVTPPEITTSVIVPVITTEAPPPPPITSSTPTTAQPEPAPSVETTADNAPRTTQAPAPPLSSSSDVEVPPSTFESVTSPITTTQDSPDTPQTTESANDSPVTSSRKLQTFTQTLPDGKVTVITSTSFVEATGSTAPGATSSEDPDLQNIGARDGTPTLWLFGSVLTILYYWV